MKMVMRKKKIVERSQAPCLLHSIDYLEICFLIRYTQARTSGKVGVFFRTVLSVPPRSSFQGLVVSWGT